MAKCENCNGELWAEIEHTNFCPLCGAKREKCKGEVVPEKGTYPWAMDRLRDNKEVEVREIDGPSWWPVLMSDGQQLYRPDVSRIIRNQTNRLYRLKPTPPLEGTDEWAKKQMHNKVRLEAQCNIHPYPWCEVILSNEGRILWKDRFVTEFATTRQYRILQETPSEPEIVEWERCEGKRAEEIFFKNPSDDARYRLCELAGLKQWQLVNFTILLPNGDEIKVQQDHVWWDAVAHRWSPIHESDTSGRPGYKKRINARCANMLFIKPGQNELREEMVK